MALYHKLAASWKITNYIVDCFFLIDIIFIFNTAIIDEEDSIIIANRSEIAWQYLKGWFTIDLVAIIPFEAILINGESANLVRYTRMGRLNKVFKLMRLVRLAKLRKPKSFSILSMFENSFKISDATRLNLSFLFSFLLVSHVIACFWIIAGNLSDWQSSWIAQHYEIDNFEEVNRSDLYLTSFYFTITTITTVGYGDFSAGTFTEKIINILIMLIGVIGFSYASGSFTSYITRNAQINEVLDRKLETLDNLYKEHHFDLTLYTAIRKNLKSNYIKDVENVSQFVD